MGNTNLGQVQMVNEMSGVCHSLQNVDGILRKHTSQSRGQVGHTDYTVICWLFGVRQCLFPRLIVLRALLEESRIDSLG